MGTATKPHTGPTAPEDRDWQWSGTDKLDEIIEHGGWREVSEAHAWHDNDSANHLPEKKGAYKLPHHELVDGELEVVLTGVERAMNALLGGRGGVDIPDDERQRVYDHLARHYHQFDREPPDFH